MFKWKHWVLLILLLAGIGFPAMAQTPDAPVQVVVRELHPFVMLDEGEFSGFSIDLWRAIASQAEMDYEFVVVDTIGEQLQAVESGQADLAIGGISITGEREEFLDFSYSYFESGMQIMTRDEPALPLRELLAAMFSPVLLELLGIMLVFVLVIAHIFWLIERQHDSDFPRAYFSGMLEAIWWSVVTVTTVGYGDRTPRGPFGRLLAIMWMFLGLVLVANFTAGVTSVLTIQRLEQRILVLNDLSGRRIATVSDSSADAYLQERRINARRLDSIDEAFAMLVDDQIDAIVYDAPVLNYYAANQGQGIVQVIGPLLEAEMYAIALPSDSPLREPINKALLAVMEGGQYNQVRQTWFGSEENG